MNKLKLTKKIVSGNRVVFSPSWITDGHWAIKRELVEHGEHLNAIIADAFLDTVGSSDMTDEQIAKAIPCDPNQLNEYKMSGVILVFGEQLRVFFNDNNEWICVNECFRSMLDLETIYPSASNPMLFFNDTAEKGIMIVRVTGEVDSRLELAIRALNSLGGAE